MIPIVPGRNVAEIVARSANDRSGRPRSYDSRLGSCRRSAGLIAFYDEQVDVFADGIRQVRPITHFFRQER
jgi:hypothetical protein